MAIIAGFPVYAGGQYVPPNLPQALKLGATTQVTTSASSALVALPTDSSGASYKYLLITATATAWFNFNDGSGAAVAAAANTYAAVPGAPLIVAIPPGATSVSAIQDTAAGHLTLVGIG